VHPVEVSSVEWQPPEAPARATRLPILWVAAPLVLLFDLANVLALNRWWHPLGAGEIILSLFLTGPILGIVLILAPAAILANWVPSRFWIVVAEVLIALVIVAVLIVTSTGEHSTAGIAFIYIPFVGSAIAAAVAGLSRAFARPRT
jgi:hypothetical protein